MPGVALYGVATIGMARHGNEKYFLSLYNYFIVAWYGWAMRDEPRRCVARQVGER
jgi:hypothetical protein